ncbi:MAG: insulinase family protein [Clostridia bacterium]|nr:insulinase family protein [Clostridia bacterium]
MQIKYAKNGIRLLHDYQEDSKIICIKICVMVGSKDERDDEWGLAHLLEHMTFKSTKNQTAQQIAETMDRLGGHFNAYTSNELTVYYITTTIQNAKEAIQCLSDIFVNTEYIEEEFQKEKSVVCSEIKMYEDDYPYICQSNMISNVFCNTPIQHPLAGTVESVSGFTIQKLREFKLRNYTPGKIVVSTAGGLKIDDIYQMLDEYMFSKYDNSQEPFTYAKPQLLCEPKAKKVYEKKDTKQFYCAISMPGYNIPNPDTLIESMCNIMLGGCMSSRLFVGVREEKGLVYHISCNGSRFSEYGINKISFICNKDKATQTLQTIRDILDKVKNEGLQEEELDKAKMIYINSLVLNREALSDVANLNFKSYIYNDKIQTLDEKIALANQVTLQQVNTRVKEILDYTKFTYSIVSDTDEITPQDFFE